METTKQSPISTKMGYVRTDGWRGYSQPIHAVAGANDTGTYNDSPCPSHVREDEISRFTKKLKAEGIRYKTKWCQTSNVFCMHQYVIVSETDHARAYEIAKEHEKDNTRLFYACEILSPKNEVK